MAAPLPAVLVVEPNPNFASIVAGILRGEGYPVLVAESAEHALQQCDQRPDIGLAIIEVFLPEASGIDLAERIEKRILQVKILFLSSIPEEPLRAKFIGTKGFVLEKPIALRDLADAVRQMLQGK